MQFFHPRKIIYKPGKKFPWHYRNFSVTLNRLHLYRTGSKSQTFLFRNSEAQKGKKILGWEARKCRRPEFFRRCLARQNAVRKRSDDWRSSDDDDDHNDLTTTQKCWKKSNHDCLKVIDDWRRKVNKSWLPLKYWSLLKIGCNVVEKYFWQVAEPFFYFMQSRRREISRFSSG